MRDLANSGLAMHPSMALSTNPVCLVLPILSRERLVEIASQYTVFPAHIVSLLEKARSCLGPWNDVQAELGRNIAEELGGTAHGGSHYEILCHGMAEEYSVDVSNVALSDGTLLFIDTLFGLVTQVENERAAGAIYAIEATAVNEISAVQRLLNRLSTEMNDRDLKPESAISKFIDLHIDVYEPSHEAGLRSVLEYRLREAPAMQDFSESFHSTVSAMDTWWDHLASIES